MLLVSLAKNVMILPLQHVKHFQAFVWTYPFVKIFEKVVLKILEIWPVAMNLINVLARILPLFLRVFADTSGMDSPPKDLARIQMA